MNQEQLFDPKHLDRYSQTSMGVVLQLPPSSARAFWVGSALGRIKGIHGFHTIGPTNPAVGTLIQHNSRSKKEILAVLDIDPHQWQVYVRDWVSRYVAHKCGWGTAFLFVEWLQESCPGCGAVIPVDHVIAQNLRGRYKRTHHVPETDITRPQDGHNTSVQEVITGPLSHANSGHPGSGVLRGLNKGVRGSEGSRGSREGSKKSRTELKNGVPVDVDLDAEEVHP